MLEAFLLSAGGRTQSVIAQSSCEAEYIAATAATSEAKYIQALFLSCGQHVNIHLRSDSAGAIGMASRSGCKQRLPRCVFESATNVADADTKPTDVRSSSVE